MHNLGRPPRRLVLLHLDGVSEVLAEPGTPVLAGTREVGRVGSVVRHYELGVIALALVKQSVAVDAALTVAGSTAAIDPDDARPRPTTPWRRPESGCARSGLRRSAGDLQHSHHRRAHGGGVGEGRRPGAAGDRRGGRGDRAGLPGGRRRGHPPARPRRRDPADARPRPGARGGRRGARVHRPRRPAVQRRRGDRPVRRAARRPRRRARRRVADAGHGELRPRRLHQPLGPDRRAAHADAAARDRARSTRCSTSASWPRSPGCSTSTARRTAATCTSTWSWACPAGCRGRRRR